MFHICIMEFIKQFEDDDLNSILELREKGTLHQLNIPLNSIKTLKQSLSLPIPDLLRRDLGRARIIAVTLFRPLVPLIH